MTRWIKCSDYPPPSGMDVLIYGIKKEHGIIINRFFVVSNNSCTIDGRIHYDISFDKDNEYTLYRPEITIIAWSMLPIITKKLIDMENI